MIRSSVSLSRATLAMCTTLALASGCESTGTPQPQVARIVAKRHVPQQTNVGIGTLGRPGGYTGGSPSLRVSTTPERFELTFAIEGSQDQVTLDVSKELYESSDIGDVGQITGGVWTPKNDLYYGHSGADKRI